MARVGLGMYNQTISFPELVLYKRQRNQGNVICYVLIVLYRVVYCSFVHFKIFFLIFNFVTLYSQIVGLIFLTFSPILTV